ncbi:MAG: hypothetical protein KC561_13870 [Myxococcales bacterium]|nr:hypothetical protein [Myxococcales bacterium]
MSDQTPTQSLKDLLCERSLAGFESQVAVSEVVLDAGGWQLHDDGMLDLGEYRLQSQFLGSWAEGGWRWANEEASLPNALVALVADLRADLALKMIPEASMASFACDEAEAWLTAWALTGLEQDSKAFVFTLPAGDATAFLAVDAGPLADVRRPETSERLLQMFCEMMPAPHRPFIEGWAAVRGFNTKVSEHAVDIVLPDRSCRVVFDDDSKLVQLRTISAKA